MDSSEFRRLLEEKAAEISVSPHLPPNVVRRIRKRVAMGVTMALAAVSLGAGGVYTVVTQLNTVGRPDRLNVASRANPCPEAEPSGSVEMTSAPVLLASGRDADGDWMVCSRTGLVTEPSGERAPTLCFNQIWGRSSSGYDCGLREGWPPNLFWVFPWRDKGIVFGTAPRATARVEIHMQDGPSTVAEVSDPPAEFGTRSFRFFVGYTDPYPEGATVVAKDDRGNVIEQRPLTTFFPLVVNKSGSGEGTVTGVDEQDMDLVGAHRWIHCGSQCSVPLDAGRRVALRAIPGSDSVFVRWEGDCSGTSSTCIVTLDARRSVTAVFEHE